MLISEKKQYSKSGYHPDSTLKTHFHVSKITKSGKIVKKGKYVYNSHFYYSQIFSYLDGRANAYINVSRFVLGTEL